MVCRLQSHSIMFPWIKAGPRFERRAAVPRLQNVFVTAEAKVSSNVISLAGIRCRISFVRKMGQRSLSEPFFPPSAQTCRRGSGGEEKGPRCTLNGYDASLLSLHLMWFTTAIPFFLNRTASNCCISLLIMCKLTTNLPLTLGTASWK